MPDDYSQFQKVNTDYSGFAKVAPEQDYSAFSRVEPTGVSASATLTGYHPVSPDSPEYRMEGGKLDKMGNPIFTLDQFRRGDAPFVTIAGDPRIPYGTTATSPQFPGVPFKVNDTGSAFKNVGLTRFDVARDTSAGSNSDENNRTVQFDLGNPNFALAQEEAQTAAPAAQPQVDLAESSPAEPIKVGINAAPASTPPSEPPKKNPLFQLGERLLNDVVGLPVSRPLEETQKVIADNKPLIAPPSVETIQKALPGLQTSFPALGFLTQDQQAGLVQGIGDAVSGLTSPQNLAILASTAGAPAIAQKAIAIGFTVPAATDLYQRSQQLANIKDSRERARQFTGMVMDAAVATGGALVAAKLPTEPVAPAERPPVQTQPASSLTPQGPMTYQPFQQLEQKGVPNASEVTSPEGLPVQPLRQDVGGQTPLQQSGQAAGAGQAEVQQPARPSKTEAIATEQNKVPFGFGPGAASAEENLSTATQLQQLTATIGKELATKNPESIATRINKSVTAVKGKFVSGKESLTQGINTLRATWLALKNGYLNPTVEGDFRSAVKDWHLADSKTSFYAREFAKKIRSTIKDPLVREALTNYIQADGDHQVLIDRAAKSNAKYRPGYEAALKLNDAQKAFAANIRQYFDGMLQDGINAGLLDHGVENYITQIWKRPNSVTRALQADLQTGRLQTNFNYARQRIFGSFFDGEQAGFSPASKDVSALVTAYDVAFNRSIAARGFVKSLRSAKSPEGDPVVRFSGTSQAIAPTDAPPEAYLIRSRSIPDSAITSDGRRYRVVDHPALRGWKFAVQDEGATPTYYQSDMLVHPDYAPQLRNMLTGSAFRQGKLGAAVTPFLKLGGLAKQTKLSLSIFHLDQEGLHGLFHRINPFNLEQIDFNNPVHEALVRGGLQVADYHAMELFSEGLTGGGIVSKIPVLGKVQNWFNDFLFKDYIPRLKMTMATHAFERNLKRYGDKLSPDQIAELTASQANAAFGELNYKLMARNQTMQDFLRLTVLAPDFLEARSRFVGQALRPYGQEQRVALLLMGASLYTASRLLNKWLDNDPHWEMRNAFSVIYNGRAYHLRSVLGDTSEFVSDPRRFFSNRESAFSKLALELTTGRDYRGIKISSLDAVKDFLRWFVPIPVENRPDSGGLGQRLLASAGVSNKPAETAVTRMYQTANDFRENLNDPKVNAELQRARAETYMASDYAPAMRAIQDGNDQLATEEIAKLIKEKGKTRAALAKYVSSLPFKPFTGSKILDLRMQKSLTPEQRSDYMAARSERMQIARKFFQLIPAAEQLSQQ